MLRNCQSDVVQVSKGDVSGNMSFDPVRLASASSRQITLNSGGASECDNNLLKGNSFYNSPLCSWHQEGNHYYLN